MILYFGTFSFEIVPIIIHRPAPGSVYRSPQLYARLLPEMDADNSSVDAVRFLILFYFFLIFLVIYLLKISNWKCEIL
jgi:hypothetical protein